jgi:hypothetical protein
MALMRKPPKNVKARPFVFSTTGGMRPFSGFSKAKVALDKHIAEIRKEDGRDHILVLVTEARAFMHSKFKRARTDPMPVICYSQRHFIRPSWDTSVRGH